MTRYRFDRECRTAFSECYNVLDEERNIGRFDVHFVEPMVHATLNIDESLTSDDIQEVIDAIDHEILDSIGIVRHEVVIHVHQGRDLGVYSTREFDSTNGGFQHSN